MNAQPLITQEGSGGNWLKPRLDNIPSDLKVLLRWGVSTPIPRQGGGYAKAPRHPVTGRLVATNRPEEWASFDECALAVEDGRYLLIGVLLDKTTGIVGGDCDKVESLFRRYPEVGRLVAGYRKAGGYTERSPSGTGLRFFVRGVLPRDGLRRDGLELYQDKRFLTVTGHGVGAIL